ncbi:MAG: hypothetical protein V4687_02470 [Bacteroidota bacterium]
MKNIFVPTDFKLESLDCLPAICSQFKNEEVSFYFVHVFKLSDSITDLLMLSRRSREYEVVSDEFYNQCAMLKRQYQQIKELKIDFLYGSTLNMFKNYLEANEINAVLDLASCSVSKINKSSLDPAVLISKSGLPVVSLERKSAAETRMPRQVQLNEQELIAV